MPAVLSASTEESPDDATRPDITPPALRTPHLVAGIGAMVGHRMRESRRGDKTRSGGQGEVVITFTHRRGQRPPGGPAEARRAFPDPERHRDHAHVPVVGGAGAADQARGAVRRLPGGE